MTGYELNLYGPSGPPFCDTCGDAGCADCCYGNSPDTDMRWLRSPEPPQLSMWDLMCL